MPLTLVRNVISELVNVGSPDDIDADFSFINNTQMNEDSFYIMLEILEKTTNLDLVNNAWRFEDVNELVNYISKNK